MERFFYPNSIVIFGASKNEKKGGNHVLRNILNFTRDNVFVIHPRHQEIYGIKCYKEIFELPQEEIDLAIIILPVEYVLDTLEECLRFGVKSIILESGSLYIKGENDKNIEKRVQDIKSKIGKLYESRIMGPNSIGIYSAKKNNTGLITSLINFDQLPTLKERNLAVVSQTGLTLSGLLQSYNYIQELGISKIASIGNKFDVNESDILDFLENDDDTDAIGLYLEDIKDGIRFKEQCRRIVKDKPIILLKSGKTEKGKKAIISHTKSLAGNYKVIEALCRQLGIIEVDDFDEMFNVAKCLLNQPIPKSNRIGIISISGAGTVLSSDLSEKYDLSLVEMDETQIGELHKIFPKFAWHDIYNPLDIWSAVEKVGPDTAYKFSGDMFLKENNIDILIYFLTGIEETEFDWNILHEFNQKYPNTAIYMGFFGGDKKLLLKWREVLEDKLNIPTFESITTLFRTISKIMRLKKKDKKSE
jgi:acetyltransferase